MCVYVIHTLWGSSLSNNILVCASGVGLEQWLRKHYMYMYIYALTERVGML